MGGLATAKLVANWFDRGRGMALGVATMGISLSGVLMPVLSALLVEAVGWRGGSWSLAPLPRSSCCP